MSSASAWKRAAGSAAASAASVMPRPGHGAGRRPSADLTSAGRAARRLPRVRRHHLETDEVGSDSPYVLVFATSPTNPSATAYGAWGPGGWDNAVDTGDTYYPNATLAGGVHAGWTLWSVLQVAFWHDPAVQQFEMTFGIVSAISNYLDNDDIVAIRRSTVSSSTAGFDVSDNGDGGAYWLRFKLV